MYYCMLVFCWTNLPHHSDRYTSYLFCDNDFFPKHTTVFGTDTKSYFHTSVYKIDNAKRGTLCSVKLCVLCSVKTMWFSFIFGQVVNINWNVHSLGFVLFLNPLICKWMINYWAGVSLELYDMSYSWIGLVVYFKNFVTCFKDCLVHSHLPTSFKTDFTLFWFGALTNNEFNWGLICDCWFFWLITQALKFHK